MAEFSVTTSNLRQKAEELSNLNQQFMNQVNTLEETENSLNGMWEGEARNSFHTAFQRDVTQMHNFYNAIAQYVAAIENSATNYENAENKNIELANNRSYA